MIVSQYHVFGSGHCTIYVFIRPHLTIGQYVGIMSDMYKRAVDDGHNGFVGTKSADDPTDSIRTKFQNYTGVRPLPPEGFVHLPELRIKGMRQLVDAGFADAPATLAGEIYERLDNNLRAEISKAVLAADVCCPEQVCDACFTRAKVGGDWRAELAKAVANDATEQKVLGINE